ncbi:MAG: PIN domain-containing protein [Nanoarchaeota archaeon]|nr:PIN domain-containing protein [Nanoarchaeota archaeon]
MKLVIDTNILFSFFWKNSLTRELIINSSFELISPKLALKELNKYNQEIIKKTKINNKEFNNQLKKLKELVKFIDGKNYQIFIQEAQDFSPDKSDSEFFALCLKENTILWSNDSLLKNQNKIKVLSTQDLIESLFG